MSYKIDYKFVPVPLDFLNDIINNNNIPLSHRVLAVIYRQIFNTNKKEKDKLTESYIAKVLNCKDRRNIQRAIRNICKHYPFIIESNGKGFANKILLKSFVKNDAGTHASKMTQGGASKTTQEHASKMTHTIDIESTIVDSIDNKEMIEMTGDEWR